MKEGGSLAKKYFVDHDTAGNRVQVPLKKVSGYKRFVGFHPDVVFDHLQYGNVTAADFLNGIADACRALNDRWWHSPKSGRRIKRNPLALMMLMVTELAEAAEGERKDVMDTHLPHRKMVEVEFADCIIRILDYAAAKGLDVGGALVEKCRYNWTRQDHSNKARRSKGGKKF